MQVEQAAWKLQRSVPPAQFRLLPNSGGTPQDHPRKVLIQALAMHIQQLVALPDELREPTFGDIHGNRSLGFPFCGVTK
jgi:hypothetical protein